MAFYVGISARQHYIGRYIAGLTWYAAITGQPVDAIKYNPAPEEKYSIEDLPVGGVRKTVNPPYEIFIGRIFACVLGMRYNLVVKVHYRLGSRNC